MAEDEQHRIINSIREYLKLEQEVYGPFQVPEPAPAPQKEEAMAVSDENIWAESSESVQDAAEPLSANSLDELRAICEKSDELRTDLAGTNLVFGTGNPGADIMFIGEAPGAQEDKQGEPFVGRAGQLLNKILAAIHFNREDVYIANILKHRPPNNRDPLPEERLRSLPYLYRQIDLIDPRWIVCLGRVSAQTLLETTEPMKTLRGRFHPFRNNFELMVTFHPAALLRNPAWKRDTWEDMKMLRRSYDELTGNRDSQSGVSDAR
ncbi:uracil-DNA glycosylase [Balneolales bacterium ANBcel1]|nr:uracil-DNA glycosylase [Balneolales bacterium ANBcel1]